MSAEIENLKQAARKVDISFFGILLENNLRATPNTLPYSDRSRLALEQTLASDILVGGFDDVIDASKNEEWAATYITPYPNASQALEKIKQEKNRVQQ